MVKGHELQRSPHAHADRLGDHLRRAGLPARLTPDVAEHFASLIAIEARARVAGVVRSLQVDAPQPVELADVHPIFLHVRPLPERFARLSNIFERLELALRQALARRGIRAPMLAKKKAILEGVMERNHGATLIWAERTADELTPEEGFRYAAREWYRLREKRNAIT